MPDDKKTIEPIDADFDEVARAMITPATSLSNKFNALVAKSSQSPATPKQGVLDLGIEVERVVGGIEMGVLENGIPYLTQRGLAEMTGAARRSIQEITEEWQVARATDVWPRGRMQFFREYLTKAGFDEPSLFIEITKDGSPHYAYPDQALAEFRHWFRVSYLTTKYPAYILKKASVLPGGVDEARQLAAMYEPKAIEDKR